MLSAAFWRRKVYYSLAPSCARISQQRRHYYRRRLPILRWLDDIRLSFQKQNLLFSWAMKERNKAIISIPFGVGRVALPLSYSELAGHGSFLFLALSYLETDFLNLRLYASSAITLSIIFQYYREFPLWIPIRWNALFLVINVAMIAALLEEKHAAENLPEEQRTLFDVVFRSNGMDKVDFKRMISSAERMERKKGESIVMENKANDRVGLVFSGRAVVKKEGEVIGTISQFQFIGALSFLEWEKQHQGRRLSDELDKRTSYRVWSGDGPESGESFIGEDVIDDMAAFLTALFNYLTSDATGTGTTTAVATETAPGGSSDEKDNTAVDSDNADRSSTESGSIRDSQQRWNSPLRQRLYDLAETASAAVASAASSPSADFSGPGVSDPAGVPQSTVSPNYSRQITDNNINVDGSGNSSKVRGSSSKTTAASSSPSKRSKMPISSIDISISAIADAVCEEDCVVYSWRFAELHDLLLRHPSIELVFERALSADLSAKMARNYQQHPKLRYQQILAGTLIDGEITPLAKEMLVKLRQESGISDSDHAAMVQRLGWTQEEYAAGYKSNVESKTQTALLHKKYEEMLQTELENTNKKPLSHTARTQLRLFRTQNGIGTSAHMHALNKLGWSLDDYEAGTRNTELISRANKPFQTYINAASASARLSDSKLETEAPSRTHLASTSSSKNKETNCD